MKRQNAIYYLIDEYECTIILSSEFIFFKNLVLKTRCVPEMMLFIREFTVYSLIFKYLEPSSVKTDRMEYLINQSLLFARSYRARRVYLTSFVLVKKNSIDFLFRYINTIHTVKYLDDSVTNIVKISL